jgi:hypothetical protein
MSEERPRYYSRTGEPMTLIEWALAIEHMPIEERQVGYTEIGAEGVHVSTVWLGLDSGFGAGPPLIFETMIFGGPLDDEQWRYATEEEARAGHANAVNLAWLEEVLREGDTGDRP